MGERQTNVKHIVVNIYNNTDIYTQEHTHTEKGNRIGTATEIRTQNLACLVSITLLLHHRGRSTLHFTTDLSYQEGPDVELL